MGLCYSCVSFRMPNSLRSTPRSSRGLLNTITCIPIPPFRLIPHYKQFEAGMFRDHQKKLSPPPFPR